MILPIQSAIERGLYILLVFAFIGMGTGMYFQAQANQKLSNQNQFLIKQYNDGRIDTQKAREANKARQDSIIGYIKCLVLLPYDSPGLSNTSTRAEVVTALDKCAKDNQ